jgi:serine/threonine protein kinase/Tol biopolymer transport system component
MSLTAGARLGPYEVIAAIGAGGMGEVYKARDTRLDRIVALKLIQTHVAASPEFRERFEREARAISALDHPHICTLYDIGHDAQADYLVMQYLEGETLADRLARSGKPRSDPSQPSSGPPASTLTAMSRGPMSLETALKYASEIAHALDAAHRRGIVHRDLKPGNVMLTKAGTKLLDFGLAKLAVQEAGASGFGDGGTRTSPLTGQGAILGTLSYMSPEQLEGREVDTRSDIFAFGALLYEMLTGRRAFESDSQAGTIAAILSADPPPLHELADIRTTLPVVAHRALDRLLRKCLAKDPDDRWHSAADLSDELTWINEERLRAVAEPSAPPAPATPAVPASNKRALLATAVGAVVVAALAGSAAWWYPRGEPAAEPIAFAIGAPEGVPISTGVGLLALSPNGRRLAFTTGIGEGLQLWIRELDSLDARRVDRGIGAWHPSWSPDSATLVYTGAGGGIVPLRRIDPGGGTPLTLAPEAAGLASWGVSGVVLFTGPGGKLHRIAAAGGDAAVAMELDTSRQEAQLLWPHFLPDGRRYLVTARSNDRSKHAIYLASLDAPGRTHLLDVLSNVQYADGHLFYQREGTLMAHPFDVSNGRFTGDPVPTIERIHRNATNGRAAFSLSSSGDLAYRSDDGDDASSRSLAWFDRTGKALGRVGSPGAFSDAQLSPDGRQVVVVMEDGPQESVTRTLWLVDVDRGVRTRFTKGTFDEYDPIWSRDGASIVFASIRERRQGIYRRAAGGGATSDELLYESSEEVRPSGFSPDGRILLFNRGVYPNTRVWALPLAAVGPSSAAQSGPKPYEVFPGSTTNDFGATFSPDGRWIAYSSIENQKLLEGQVYIQPFPADGRRIVISTATGYRALWTADGHIVYRAGPGTFESVALTPAAGTLRPAPPERLFVQPRIAFANFSFSIDPRGERFLLPVADPKTGDPAPTPITVITNWTATLRKK